MAPLNLPPIPASLKPIQHYLKTASEHDNRDPAIAYWCRLYALQQGLILDKKSKEALAVLMTLMEWLEVEKKNLRSLETVSNEIVAQAQIENHALKLFHWAEDEDRAGRYNKNVVKVYYTAGMLLDVLTTFGELNEEVSQQRKYAKWRAAHLHNCLKTGETPEPPPAKDSTDVTAEDLALFGETNTNLANDFGGLGFSDAASTRPPSGPSNVYPPAPAPAAASPSSYYPPAPAAHPPQHPQVYEPPPAASPGFVPSAEQNTRAQKLCKFAMSALTYDDIPTAVDNLQRALRLLQTGKEN